MLPTSKVKASSPKPKDKVEDVIRDVILSWKPGEFADKHNVYLGTVLDDVNNADAGSSLLVGPAQDANSYNPGRLEFDQTYYWRIDEVNAPPDLTVYKGDTWSFTVESYAIPLEGENITATASSHAENQEPEKTIDGSGLDENDLHSVNTDDMWLTSAGDPGPAWIQYEFDKPYKLHEMLVWNYNGDSILSGLGSKDVTIEYSTDGTNLIQLDDTFEFAQAPGMNGYASDITVNFDGILVKLVKINIINNRFPGFSMYGLSEVRFMVIPVFARKPNPESETTDFDVASSLTWRAGREAAEHKVYISTDRQAVIDGTVAEITVNQTSYSPALDLSSTYYWRIDEVNNAETPSIWQGDIWSFSTQEYLAVDDFESYNDIPTGEEGSNLVYETWIDGYDNPSFNGSTMGYSEAYQPTMETDTVHGGKQSAPFLFDNTTASISEVSVNTSDLSIGGDWTVGAPSTLSLWVYGDLNNPATEQMYVKINSAKVVISDVDLTLAAWQEVTIALADFNTNLSNVTTFSIGIERTGATGGSGMVFIDDIHLYW